MRIRSMVKNIYKAVALLAIFLGALFFFGRQMESDVNDTGVKKDITAESYPVLQLETQGYKVNSLYGYSAPMKADIVRESMTPLNASKNLKIYFANDGLYLTSLSYQILDKESGEAYETSEPVVLGNKQSDVTLQFDYNFSTSTEYILDLIGTANDGREIHYYTRLKYYVDDSHLAEKLSFVKKFHKQTFQKIKAEELENYLEPDSKNRNNTLAKVDITSNSDLVTWGSLSPEQISSEWITIKEYNMETACVQYNYFVKADTDSGQETYHVKEFYRVRYASGQNYLLNFERTMEAGFDVKLASTQTGQLKVGITSETNKMLSDKDNKKLYFSRGGDVYQYDLTTNQIHSIYTSFSSSASYLHKAYDEQGIRLLKVDDEGSLYFCAFGYFARGQYEGDVAVVLYEYTKDGELRELVYMPSSTTYQQLKEDFADYGYVSSRGIYYFTVANTVYSYNISAKRLEAIAENVKSNGFMTMEESNCYVWSSNVSGGYGENITIYNLETDEKQILYAPDDATYIRLLGVIEKNIVFGYVKKEDVTTSTDGSKVFPCYELHIVDTSGNDKKQLKPSNAYIQSTKASGNVINITLCKKTASGAFVKSGEDSILVPMESATESFRYSSRVTSKSMTEWYIQMPSSFVMDAVPKYIISDNTVYTTERFVRLEQPGIAKYYVYAVGKITASYENPRQAIREADKQMGVVMSSDHQLVWERSGSFLQNDIGGIEITKAESGVSNLAACAHMVLKLNHINVSAKDLSASNASLYDMIKKYMNKPMNLKGCTLEQVLYFVSGNKPVIAMVNDNEAVVIAGYNSSKLTIYNPKSGKSSKVSRKEYETIFKNAGNRFVSYME